MDQGESSQQPPSYTAPRFSEEQTKVIAQFYVDNYDVMSKTANEGFGKGMNKGLNKERQHLLRKLTNDLNTKYGGRFTYHDVHMKLKRLKEIARRNLREAEFDDFPFLEEDASLMEAEEIIMAKLIQVGEDLQPALNGIPKPAAKQKKKAPASFLFPNNLLSLSLQQSQRSRGVGSRAVGINHPTAAEEFDDHDQEPAHLEPATPSPQLSANRSPPKKRQRVVAKNSLPATTISSSDASIQHLQKQVLENELALQTEKKATLGKINVAIDEFRRFIAEQRMTHRGVNIANIPVDIPPGLEDVVGQL